jgi:putative chitobiose transport system substrate-binding protein
MNKAALVGLLALGGTALAAPTQITFWSWYLSPKFNSYIEGRIHAFEQLHPNIVVHWQDKQANMVQDFVAAANLGSTPDVVNLNIPETASAAQNGFLAPVTDFTPLPKLKKIYWSDPLHNFTDSGQVYGYPWYGWLNQGAMVYNSKLLKQAGITHLPKTLTQLMADSETIHRKTGAYGWIPLIIDPSQPQDPAILGIFYGDGLPIVNSKGQAVFDTPANIADLAAYVKYYRSGNMPSRILTTDNFQLQIQLYTQGKLAFIIGGPQALTRIKTANPALYAATRVVPAPLGRARNETGGGMDLVIPASSKHPHAAALFASFMSDNHNQVLFAEQTPIVPTTRLAAQNAFFQTHGSSPVAVATALVSTKGRYITPGYTPPAHSSAVIGHLNNDIEAALLGKMTPAQALKDAVAYWNSHLK